MFANAAILQGDGSYCAVRGGGQLFIHPSSVLFKGTPPPCIVYYEAVQSDRRNKTYIRMLTEVSPDILLDVAPQYYESAKNPRGSRPSYY
jgi:hypothetical protein